METLLASYMQIFLIKSLHINVIAVTILDNDVCVKTENSKCCSNFRLPFDLKQHYYLPKCPRILKSNERLNL
jgi:hypothetical protein